MYEAKGESSNHYWNESLEVIKMGKKKSSPLNVRILRKKYNHRRSLSEQIPPRPSIQGSTLTQLIGEYPDSSDFTAEEGSVRIVESPQSTHTSSISESNEIHEVYKLRRRNDELLLRLMEQSNQIVILESKVEALTDFLKQKEEDAERVMDDIAFSDELWCQMASLKTDKCKLTLEIDALRQVILEQAERIEKMSLDEQLPLVPESSTYVLMNLVDNSSEQDIYIKTLQEKINELIRIVKEKDTEIKELKQVLQCQDLGLIEFKKTIDETSRRQSNVQSELEAASRKTYNLINTTNILYDTVENRNNELKAMEQSLQAEKETIKILQGEKERAIEKYEALAKEKASNDKTFMHLYDELILPGNVQFSEVESEDPYSEGHKGDKSQDLGVEGYFYLNSKQKIRTRSRKCKPMRAPPPLPSQSLETQTANKMREQSVYQSDETSRLNQANYEYFLMSSIAVRMNLAAVYSKDEIMAVDLGKLWEFSQISQIPMNRYYFYIEDAIRKEFNLSKPPYSNSTSEQKPINTQCCIVM